LLNWKFKHPQGLMAGAKTVEKENAKVFFLIPSISATICRV
jgi:hypothetical protein